MIRRFVWIIMLSLSCLFGWSEEPKLPVFTLKYDGALGSEETEEEDIEQSSNRHTVSLRIKEELSKRLTASVITAFSRKEYLLQSGSYSYTYVNPTVTLDVSEKLRWTSGIRSKWIFYDEMDYEGNDKDFTSLRFDTSLIFRPIKELKLTPSVRGEYDLHTNETKTKQTYTLGFAIDARISSVTLGGRYRAITRLPLSPDSDVAFKLNNEFGAGLSWDPNK